MTQRKADKTLIDRCRALLADGHTYERIAWEMDITVGSVAGLVRRHTASKVKHKSANGPAAKAALAKAGHGGKRTVTVAPVYVQNYVPRKPDMEEPVSRKVEMIDLGRVDCRYPSGDGAEITFCGHPATFGPYCPYHSEIVWQRRQPRAVSAPEV